MPDRHWTEAEFWATGLRVGSCLEWQGRRKRTGYGQLSWDNRTWTAPRMAWTLKYGPIPAGMHVLHTCDNPPCFEPLHLFLGTHQDNMRDRNAKGRASGQSGERNPSSKLTLAQVQEIRRLRAAGATARALGRRFGVSHQTVSKIVSGLKWGSLP